MLLSVVFVRCFGCLRVSFVAVCFNFCVVVFVCFRVCVRVSLCVCVGFSFLVVLQPLLDFLENRKGLPCKISGKASSGEASSTMGDYRSKLADKVDAPKKDSPGTFFLDTASGQTEVSAAPLSSPRGRSFTFTTYQVVDNTGSSLLVCTLSNMTIRRICNKIMSSSSSFFQSSKYLSYFLVLVGKFYKGTASPAADAPRYARTRKNTKTCEGGRKKRPLIWRN